VTPVGTHTAEAPRRRVSRPALSIIWMGLLATGLLTGCQSDGPGPGNLTLQASEPALPAMERIALTASKCWFRSGNRNFKPYRLAMELNSLTGRPRILLVPRNKPEDRPLAVIEAEGDPATIKAYGALLFSPTGNLMVADIRDWTKGSTTCNSAT